jgi:hypothetical protein
LDRIVYASYKALNDFYLHLVYRSLYSAFWMGYTASYEHCG